MQTSDWVTAVTTGATVLNGMRNLLKKPAVREAWERIARDTDYGPGFVAFVEAEGSRAAAAWPTASR